MVRQVPETPGLPGPPRGLPVAIITWAGDLIRVLAGIFAETNIRLNRVLPKDGTEAMNQPLRLVELTTGTRPPAALWKGALIFVSDGAAGSKFQASDGGSWLALGSEPPPPAIAFPGAQGFGSTTRHAWAGGTDPVLLKVTNLNDSGAGSLDAALRNVNPRVIVFETSGTIDMTNGSSSSLPIVDPYCFVAGQTAPSPGITIKGLGFGINATDVLVQHIRVRVGDQTATLTYGSQGSDFTVGATLTGGTSGATAVITADDDVGDTGTLTLRAIDGTFGDPAETITDDVTGSATTTGTASAPGPSKQNLDGFSTQSGAERVVIDHCSVSWAIDGSIDIHNSTIGDITISNFIVSEHLDNAGHPDGPHSLAFLLDKNVAGVSIIGGLVAHCNARVPQLAGNVPTELINLMVYNNRDNNPLISTSAAPTSPNYITIMGCKQKGGPDTPASKKYMFRVLTSVTAPTEVFLNDLVCDFGTGSTCLRDDEGGSEVSSRPSLANSGALPASTAANLETYLEDHCGARPLDRDAVDTRVISEMKAGTGSIIDWQEDVGGWPALAENTRTYDEPANPNDDSGDGYTNQEKHIHTFSDEVGM